MKQPFVPAVISKQNHRFHGNRYGDTNEQSERIQNRKFAQNPNPIRVQFEWIIS